MSCYHPFHAFPTGRLTDNGKREFIIDFTGECDRLPQSACLRKGIPVTGDLVCYIPLPCGSCIGCREDKARAWSARMMAELSVTSKPSYFVTLTYDDAHLPACRLLNKPDLQLFHKRLRKAFGPFRFFACGEYGENTHRPHYHVVYFGLEIRDLSLVHRGAKYSYYDSSTLRGLWGMGDITIGDVSPSSCSYVAGYVTKKLGDDDSFLIMSRRPGIGLAVIRGVGLKDNYAFPTGKGSFVSLNPPRSAFPDMPSRVFLKQDLNVCYVNGSAYSPQEFRRLLEVSEELAYLRPSISKRKM